MSAHLTFDELTEFASLTELNGKSEAKAAAVNKHLAECSHCRDLAAAVTDIYEALMSIPEKKEKQKRQNFIRKEMYRI